ncbi:MAG: polysaccharide deacetylase family protein [Cetobacterium sp.]|uniref:polysaccharide deacetylase family protein n=2 Tax=Cetobacterium sp. TaxID=2071632 RepID=UPI002FC765BC
MNILMALSQLEVTGAEVYATTLSDELISRDNNVYIVSDTLTKESKAEYFKIQFNKRSFSERFSQVKNLLKIIKEKDIHVIHAHSRASSWSASIAAKIAGIPLVTTIHGRQPVHLSRKIIKSFGDYSIAVCENIKNQVINDLGVNSKNISVLRNPIDETKYPFIGKTHSSDRKIISIIGRLSGPKGEVTLKLLEMLYKRKDFKIQVIGGKVIPQEFKKYEKEVDFLGYIDNVSEKIAESDIVIGAGRVAVEGILSGKPTIAIGEATSIGLITKDTLKKALDSNFGDIGKEPKAEFYWQNILKDVDNAFSLSNENLLCLRNMISEEFSLNEIVKKIELIYEKQIIKKRKYEIPVIMYHRVIKDESEKGVHGTYVTLENFEKHMEYLKYNGYETITFKDLLDNNFKKRFDKDKKWVMLTFDDGYVDNYENAFPILKKYGFKGVIYLVSDLNYNKWDVDNEENPERNFKLMDTKQILEMKEYGIEFGGHTLTHPRLSKIDLELAKNEMLKSKITIENKIGCPLYSFAYPYGDLNESLKSFAKEIGYPFAVATDSGPGIFSEDLYQIRRIAIFPTNNMFNFKRKVSGKYIINKLGKSF